MSRSGIPGVTEQAVMYVQRVLLPGHTNAQATAAFTRMIKDSIKSLSTQFNFFIHNLAQLKFSSHSEGALLSFVSKTYRCGTCFRSTAACIEFFKQLLQLECEHSPRVRWNFVCAAVFLHCSGNPLLPQ